jgi:hypothetical protein
VPTTNIFEWLLVLLAIAIAACVDSETRCWIAAGCPPRPNPAQSIVWKSPSWDAAIANLAEAGYSIVWQDNLPAASDGSIVWPI